MLSIVSTSILLGHENGSRACPVNGSLQCIPDVDQDCVEDKEVNILYFKTYKCYREWVYPFLLLGICASGSLDSLFFVDQCSGPPKKRCVCT